MPYGHKCSRLEPLLVVIAITACGGSGSDGVDAPVLTCEADQDGQDCDDLDACTVDDSCATGICVGQPMACDAPPADVCLTPTTLRRYLPIDGFCDDGDCNYHFSDFVCAAGCEDGRCACPLAAWQSDIIDEENGTGAQLDIAADPAFGIHVAYRRDIIDFPGPALKYAFSAFGGEFFSQTLDDVGNPGVLPRLAVDDDGTAHIVSLAIDGLEARYLAGNLQSGFALKTLSDSVGITGGVAIDDARALHLVSQLGSNGILYTVRAPNGDLVEEYPRADGQFSGLADIALDANGMAHIIAYQTLADELLYFVRTGDDSWTEETFAASLAEPAHFPKIAVDSSGGVHIGYGDRASGDLIYAYKAPGNDSFVRTTVDSFTILQANGMVVDSFGNVHLAAIGDNRLQYSFRAAGADTFQSETAIANRNFGDGLAMTILPQGEIFIAWQNIELFGPAQLAIAKRACPLDDTD